MLRRVNLFCIALVVAVTSIIVDTQTAEAQLFRRLRSRIESAIATPPPIQPETQPSQRFPRQITPQPDTQLPTPTRPQGQRVSPIGSPTDPAGARPSANDFGKSILVPTQRPELGPSEVATQNDAVGIGSAATPAASRASLGIEVVPSRSGVPGLKVVSFNESSTADEAGLELDDVIVAVEGISTPTISEIAQLLSERKSGDYVRAEIVRGRTSKVVMLPLISKTVLTAKPPTALANDSQRPTEPQRPIELGIEIEKSNGDRGVIVTDVTENSPAAAAGLQVGDRIVSLDGRLLLASHALNREFLKLKSGDQISLQVVRDGKLVTADVKMLDPSTLAKVESKQSTRSEESVLGGIGSVLGGLFSGNTDPKPDLSSTGATRSDAKSSVPNDEMAFGDNEPVQQAGFEKELDGQRREFKVDPPSLETLELPPSVATPIAVDAPPQQAPLPQSSEDLREKIRQLEKRLKDLEAYLKQDAK